MLNQHVLTHILKERSEHATCGYFLALTAWRMENGGDKNVSLPTTPWPTPQTYEPIMNTMYLVLMLSDNLI